MKKDFGLEFKKNVEEIRNNRNQFILDYLDLVNYVIKNNFKDVNYDKEDLYQIGILGLIEATDSFSTSNKKRFKYYAATMIKKRINNFIEQNSNVQNINYNTINEMYIDEEINIAFDYETQDERKNLKKYVYNLPYLPREVMKMYFGFYGKCYSFREIALIFNTKESKIKSLVAKELRTIRKLISTNKMDSKIKKISKVK